LLSNKKILSICYSGRNDNYGGKFVDRLALSINYLAANAKLIGVLNELEVLVTDWNSKIPLSKTVKLSLEGKQICKFIPVPADIAQTTSHGSNEFHSSISANVAIRRACGDFILIGPADILFPEYQLGQLMKLLMGKLHTCFAPEKTGLMIGRKYLPLQFNDELAYNSFSVLNKYLLFCDDNAESGRYLPGLATGYGAIILHKDIIFQLEGINEQFVGWGFSDIELGLKISEDYPCVTLSKFGIIVYDFEPNSRFLQTKRKQLNKFDHFYFERERNKKWGLGSCDLSEESSNNEIYNDEIKSKEKTLEIVTESLVQSLISDKTKKYLIEAVYYKIPIIHSSYFPLAWFALNNKCFKFLEFGADSSASSIISAINPCAEIFFIPAISSTVKDANDVPFILNQATLLYEKRHKGHVRFIPGDTDTSIERLKKTFIGRMYFDLVLIHADNLRDNSINRIASILKYIPEGGGVITTGQNIDILKKIKNVIMNESNFSCFTSDECLTSLFLKKKISVADIDQNGLQKKLKEAWKPIRRKKISLYLFYLGKLISNFSLGLVFLDYIQWPSFTYNYFVNIRQKIDIIKDF
jgi:hypothetical protein